MKPFRLLLGKVMCIALLAAGSLICCTSTVFAQDNLRADTSLWNLQRCLDYAKNYNIQLNSLRLDQQTSQQELLLSKAAVLPGVSASASQNLIHAKNLDTYNGQYNNKFTPSGAYGINTALVLYQGGYLKNDIQLKNLALQSSNLSVLEQENNITLSITQDYLTVLLDKETIIYEQQIISTTIAQVNRAKLQLSAGGIARKDVAQLQSQLANDKYTLVSAQNTKRQSLLALKQILQLPVEYPFDVAEPDTIIAQMVVPALSSVEANALASRPEIKIGEIGVQSAALSLARARSGYLPTLTASGSIGTDYNGTSPGYSTQLNNFFNQQLGLTLSVPIFSKRVNKTNVEEAKINIRQAGLTLKDIKTTLSQTVEKAYLDVINAQSQYDAAAEAFRYNQETYRIANEQLSLGATAMVDFLQQKALYVQALQQFIQAKYNAALSIQIYNFYNGSPVKLN